MTTAKTLELLKPEQREKLSKMHEVINKAREIKNQSLYKEYKDMIRGYLSCLLDLNILHNNEDFRVLFNYYTL